MIKKAAMLLSLALLTPLSHAYDQTFSAQAMLDLCSVEDTKSVEYITCISNINGYMEGLVHSKVFEELERDVVTQKKDDTLRLHEVCLDPEVSNYQLSKIYLKFIEKNPELLHKDFFTVFYESMKNAFPCAK